MAVEGNMKSILATKTTNLVAAFPNTTVRTTSEEILPHPESQAKDRAKVSEKELHLKAIVYGS